MAVNVSDKHTKYRYKIELKKALFTKTFSTFCFFLRIENLTENFSKKVNLIVKC